ncbi:3-deoxy-D-manno-octulosonic acid kinase [Thalassotalea sp. HSM 43]|uniref:3-deoxy-D-manno-octulosonic acid kinase n=1 Tax=Thalassotalea sp. HSM 43 TaxID=2552945 RepID=UPI001E58AAD6|nr:3-deoxy-D-manno-octulosonic acid kinase [Thalassotalea sp. HSM 43]
MNLSRFVKHSNINLFQEGNIRCLYDADLLNDFSVEMFDSSYWQQQNAVLGSSTGRGTAWFVQHPQVKMVLRHYYRGGLIGKLINDSYFYTGFMNTRAAKEFILLADMQQMGLPAPKPVALKIERQGLTYNADILIELIPGANDLVALLTQTELPEQSWQQIGACIKAFHQQRIYHHDLNAHNIMLDSDNKIWLIDFDQGKQMASEGPWQQQNLQRLQRSFLKEQKKMPVFHYSEENWQSLLQGYSS